MAGHFEFVWRATLHWHVSLVDKARITGNNPAALVYRAIMWMSNDRNSEHGTHLDLISEVRWENKHSRQKFKTKKQKQNRRATLLPPWIFGKD